MIQLSKNYSLPERAEEFIPIKIVSVGGAGLNALDRIVLDGLEGAEVLAANTDVQSLASSVAAHKVQLGRAVTRGLGAGGDPELRARAVEVADDGFAAIELQGRVIGVAAAVDGGHESPGASERRDEANHQADEPAHPLPHEAAPLVGCPCHAIFVGSGWPLRKPGGA